MSFNPKTFDLGKARAVQEVLDAALVRGKVGVVCEEVKQARVLRNKLNYVKRAWEAQMDDDPLRYAEIVVRLADSVVVVEKCKSELGFKMIDLDTGEDINDSNGLP